MRIEPSLDADETTGKSGFFDVESVLTGVFAGCVVLWSAIEISEVVGYL